MVERRRCARPTRRAGSAHTPAPSGPRWLIVSRIRVRRPGSARPSRMERIPTIPHTGSVPPGSAPRVVVEAEHETAHVEDLPGRDRRRGLAARVRDEAAHDLAVALVGLAPRLRSGSRPEPVEPHEVVEDRALPVPVRLEALLPRAG